VTAEHDRSNGPNGPFVAVFAASTAVFAAISLAVWAERPIVGDGVVTFFDEHYYDLNTIRAVAKAGILASIVVGLAFAVTVFAALCVTRSYGRAAFWALSVGGAIALSRVFKELVERPEIGARQVEYSFPSGNATVAIAGTFALLLFLPKTRWRRPIAAAGLVVLPLYGIALVMLLWHYPSDVIGGWALGLAWVSFLVVVFRAIVRRFA
jgi:membrane-associated phospholipid phosphatase